MDLGKVDASFLAEYVYPRLGACREDVTIGPAHGIDFGLISVGDQAIALATDPVSILPQLGLDRAGRFGIEIVLADVAVSGLAPSHLAVSFTLPPTITNEEFATLWRAVDARCRNLGISITTGHTARYPEASYPWVGAATVLAVGEKPDVVRPDGAQVGDKVLVTKGPGVEVTGLTATLFPQAPAFEPLDEETLESMRACLEYTRIVEDARTAVTAGSVHAMHDATEGGLQAALVETASAGDVRFDIESEKIPLLPGVEAFGEVFDVDPWACTTSGSLIIIVDPKDATNVRDALSDSGVPVGIAGDVSAGDGVYLDGRRIEHPTVDPSWKVYERLSDESDRESTG